MKRFCLVALASTRVEGCHGDDIRALEDQAREDCPDFHYQVNLPFHLVLEGTVKTTKLCLAAVKNLANLVSDYACTSTDVDYHAPHLKKLRQTVRSTRLSSSRGPISPKGLGASNSKTKKGSKIAKKRAIKKQAMLGEKMDDDADSVEKEALFRRFDSKRWNDDAFDFNRQDRNSDRRRRVARLSRRWEDGAFHSRKDSGGKGEDEYFEHRGAALGGEFLGASFDDGESEYSAYDNSDSALLGASFDDEF